MEDNAPPVPVTSEDLKRRIILDAGFDAFAKYGFRRTSMADIAQAAGMSRPALYQHFQGKDDIARSLVQDFYDRACGAVARALGGPGRAEDVLAAAFRAKSGPQMEALLSSPHGHELMDLSGTIASDLAAEGTQNLAQVFARWLEGEAAAGRITLEGSGEDFAQTMLAALEGIKAGGRRPSYAEYTAHQDRLAKVFAAALTR